MLVSVFGFLKSKFTVNQCLIFLDVNECLQPNICGLGTCSNIGNGGFYDCNCPPGSQETGSNTDGSLTCVG